MGWEARNRIADLRAAPLPGREPTNGHDLAGGKQIVQWSPAASAGQIAGLVLPGHPMPIMLPGGQVTQGKMPNWTEVADKMRAELDARFGVGEPWPADATHEWNLVCAVAVFQRSSLALAEAARGLREYRPAPDSMDKFPEAPEEGSKPVGGVE